MIVECPRCRARYRVEDELLDDEPTFKCSRCGHVFAYEGGGAAEPPPDEGEPEADLPAAAGDAPRAQGDQAAEAAETGGEEPEPAVAAPPPRVEAAPPPPPPRPAPSPPRAQPESLEFPFTRTGPVPSGRPAPPPADEPDFSFRDDDEDEEAVTDDAEPETPRSSGAARAQPRFVHDEDELRIEPEEEASSGRGYLLFLGVLVVFWSVVAIDLRNHAERAERIFTSLPLVGDAFAEDQLLHHKVNLEEVEGAYQKIKDERWVFVVSGRAVNTSSRPLRSVQIESVLYDAAGAPVETKSIFCGNALSLKIVRDLSSKEISLLQKLDPPKRFEIRPGDSAGFTVVFAKSDAEVKEFSARVASVQSAS